MAKNKGINPKEIFWRSVGKGVGYSALGLGTISANPFAIGSGLGILGLSYKKWKK